MDFRDPLYTQDCEKYMLSVVFCLDLLKYKGIKIAFKTDVMKTKIRENKK